MNCKLKAATFKGKCPSCKANLKVNVEATRRNEDCGCGCETSNYEVGYWYCPSSDSESGCACDCKTERDAEYESDSDCDCECDCWHDEESSEEGENWWGEPCDLTKRFSEHDAECYYCKKKPIEGLRWIYKLDEEYSACNDCVPDKKHWRLHRFSWNKPVPEAPLSEEDPSYSENTAHLQKVLTELGFMKLEHTDKYTGYFQNRTGDAVEKFRKAYGIKNGSLRVYDKWTQYVLEQVYCSCDC